MDDLLMLGDALVLSHLKRDSRQPYAEDFSGRDWEPIERTSGIGDLLLTGLTWLARCVVAPLRQARTPEGVEALVRENRRDATPAPTPAHRLAAGDSAAGQLKAA